MSQKIHLVAFFDCRTIILLLTIIILLFNLDVHTIETIFTIPGESFRRYGKGRLYCMRILYVHQIYAWLLDSRKVWAANIAIEWLPCTSM